jgi:aryl-alcohol dehydrogenase-like predicted oxidoreductase
MQLRNVGTSGLRVSAIGLGCNNFGRPLDLERSRAVIHKALDLGITLFDCGDVYGRRGGAETILGEVLGPRRKDIVLVTKFGRQMDAEGRLKGGSRRYVMMAAEASLKRLKTDWIDLYQYHLVDPLTPVEETLRALDDLVRAGKVRYIGCSHMPAWQVVDSLWTSRANNLARFIACEDEYSLLARGIERDLIPAIKAHGVGLLPYYPLASGLLTGKYRRGAALPADSRFAVITERDYVGQFMTESNWALLDKLAAFADRRGYSLLDVAMSWIASRETVASVIAGATKPEQVEANVKAAALQLTADDVAALDTLTRQPA